MSTTIADLAGTWYLVGEHRTDDQADTEAPTFEVDGNDDWMRTSGASSAPMAAPAEGLTLTISEDGAFSEVGESSVSLFDADGVETSGEGFSAHLESVGQVLAAFTSSRRLSEPVRSIADTSLLRLSDGDTDIAELFELTGGQVVRTQNVVTDGIYRTRSVLIYDRTEPASAPVSSQAEEAKSDSSPAHSEELGRAEQALVTALINSVQGDWKEIVAYSNADGSNLMTLTLSVNVDATGTHSASQEFDPRPKLDALWKAHRKLSKNSKGKQWGTAVLVLRPPSSPTWQIDYAVSRVMRGEYDETYRRYKKYLPIFLEENGFES